jgi:hypothetical protein
MPCAYTHHVTVAYGMRKFKLHTSRPLELVDMSGRIYCQVYIHCIGGCMNCYDG